MSEKILIGSLRISKSSECKMGRVASFWLKELSKKLRRFAEEIILSEMNLPFIKL